MSGTQLTVALGRWKDQRKEESDNETRHERGALEPRGGPCEGAVQSVYNILPDLRVRVRVGIQFPHTLFQLSSSVILHDLAPPAPAARIFVTSVEKSGLTFEQVRNMAMTDEKRNKPRLLHIYEPPGHFQVLAKIESECSHAEAQTAANLATKVLCGYFKEGKPVEDAVATFISLYPGHVRKGVVYQLKSLPEKRSLKRYDRNQLLFSESDAAATAAATAALRHVGTEDSMARVMLH